MGWDRWNCEGCGKNGRVGYGSWWTAGTGVPVGVGSKGDGDLFLWCGRSVSASFCIAGRVARRDQLGAGLKF
jgi:hypothetical protein